VKGEKKRKGARSGKVGVIFMLSMQALSRFACISIIHRERRSRPWYKGLNKSVMIDGPELEDTIEQEV
jgi:hypothetical protein